MKFNERYDFYFENKGICPECKRGLLMHVGCIGKLWEDGNIKCTNVRIYSYTLFKGSVFYWVITNSIYYFKKILSYKKLKK